MGRGTSGAALTVTAVGARDVLASDRSEEIGGSGVASSLSDLLNPLEGSRRASRIDWMVVFEALNLFSGQCSIWSWIKGASCFLVSRLQK